MLSPSGISVLRLKIRYRSLSFLHFLLSSIFSIPITLRSSREWSGWLKCVATSLPASLLWCQTGGHSSWCVGHFLSLLHTECYTCCNWSCIFVLHVNWFLMVYYLPVVLLAKVLVRFISWQVLHRLLPLFRPFFCDKPLRHALPQPHPPTT